MPIRSASPGRFRGGLAEDPGGGGAVAKLFEGTGCAGMAATGATAPALDAAAAEENGAGAGAAVDKLAAASSFFSSFIGCADCCVSMSRIDCWMAASNSMSSRIRWLSAGLQSSCVRSMALSDEFEGDEAEAALPPLLPPQAFILPLRRLLDCRSGGFAEDTRDDSGDASGGAIDAATESAAAAVAAVNADDADEADDASVLAATAAGDADADGDGMATAAAIGAARNVAGTNSERGRGDRQRKGRRRRVAPGGVGLCNSDGGRTHSIEWYELHRLST